MEDKMFERYDPYDPNNVTKYNVHCKGSSGGGGSSGAVSYPAYIQTIHSKWLDASATDVLTVTMVDAMNAAHSNSPWTVYSAYDPDADIAAYEAALAAFAAILAGVDVEVDWAALYAQAETSIDDFVDVGGITEAVIVADVSAFSNQLDSEITTKVLPRFRRGMQDINAVVSSAFPIGTSIIEGFRNREVAKHNSAIRLNAADKNADIKLGNVKLHNEIKQMRLSSTEQMLRLMTQHIEWREGYTKIFLEGKRIKIVAKSEETVQNSKFDESDALWDLEVFQYGANLIAAPSGGTATPGTGAKGPSTMQSAIGGALSGAVAGAKIGSLFPGVGTTAGAGIGLVLGAATAFL